MNEYQTGAVRDTGGKGRMDLLPMCALLRISKHMEDAIKPDPVTGVAHYPERNWEKGLPMHSMIDSAFRHLAKYVDGWTDEDHLCAAATNLLMAMWTEEKRPAMQDIPTRGHGEATEGPCNAGTANTRTPCLEAKGSTTEATEEAISTQDGSCGHYDSQQDICKRGGFHTGCGGNHRVYGCLAHEQP